MPRSRMLSPLPGVNSSKPSLFGRSRASNHDPEHRSACFSPYSTSSRPARRIACPPPTDRQPQAFRLSAAMQGWPDCLQIPAVHRAHSRGGPQTEGVVEQCDLGTFPSARQHGLHETRASSAGFCTYRAHQATETRLFQPLRRRMCQPPNLTAHAVRRPRRDTLWS